MARVYYVQAYDAGQSPPAQVVTALLSDIAAGDTTTGDNLSIGDGVISGRHRVEVRYDTPVTLNRVRYSGAYVSGPAAAYNNAGSFEYWNGSAYVIANGTLVTFPDPWTQQRTTVAPSITTTRVRADVFWGSPSSGVKVVKLTDFRVLLAEVEVTDEPTCDPPDAPTLLGEPQILGGAARHYLYGE